jgi:hypothetical protein
MDYILNFIIAIGVGGGLCGIVQVAHTKYRRQWIIGIAILSFMYFVISSYKTYKSTCSFDCNSIDFLISNINSKKVEQEDEIKLLETEVKKNQNLDTLFNIKEKIRVLKYDKVAANEVLIISLKELSKNCDGCKQTKIKYDSLSNKFKSINEK